MSDETDPAAGGSRGPDGGGGSAGRAGGGSSGARAGGGEFGPRGYLPERAARRARKIVLREPLGSGWIIASVAAAVVMALIGVAYWLTQAGPPRAPYVEVGPLDAVDPQGAGTVAAGDVDALVVRGAGGVRAFVAPGAEVAWCRPSGRLEARDGRVWALSGQLRGGEGASLRPLRAQVHRGVLYIDPTTDIAAPDPSAGREQPECDPPKG